MFVRKRGGLVIYFREYSSPLGNMMMTSDGEVLTSLIFKSRDEFSLEGEEKTDLPIFLETCKWLDTYFCGKVPVFTPKYRIEGASQFRRDVIEEIEKIPYGKTVTYGDIAKAICKKRGIKRMSAQAVGGAVGWNPICIIVPCHRVMGASRKLTGYGGGLDRKVALLKIEGHEEGEFR